MLTNKCVMSAARCVVPITRSVVSFTYCMMSLARYVVVINRCVVSVVIYQLYDASCKVCGAN